MGFPFGNYVLHERVGYGDMAEVFRATTSAGGGFERTVAIKRILPHVAEHPDFQEMFISEAKIASMLHHPNIAEVFDLGVEDNFYYIAMEYVHGRDMREVQAELTEREQPIIPTALALYVADAVCAALQAAHRAEAPGIGALNLIHRDISPQNIIISYTGDVKVVDFGLVKAKGRTFETGQGLIRGNLAYLSPEQASGETIDRRTDIFSLGVCLWEWLTGYRLFLRGGEAETLEAIACGDIPMPRAYNESIDEELESVLQRALHVDPIERFRSAEELQQAIRSYINRHHLELPARRVGKYLADLFPEDSHDYEHFSDSTSMQIEASSVSATFSKPDELRPAQAQQSIPPEEAQFEYGYDSSSYDIPAEVLLTFGDPHAEGD